MKAGRASQTASMVAFMRALADVGITSVPEFSDPTEVVNLRRLLVLVGQHPPKGTLPEE